MSVYRTDKQRCANGDRIIARRADFAEAGPEVVEVHEIFTDSHHDFIAITTDRRREQTEDIDARKLRDELSLKSQRLYSWSWNFVQLEGQKNGKFLTDFSIDKDIREKFFSLGPPTSVQSTQLSVDGLTHLLIAHEQDPIFNFPEDIIQTIKNTLNDLKRAIDQVTVEENSTRKKTMSHKEARANWDLYYKSLREITSGYLRMKNKLHLFPLLFRSPPVGKKALQTHRKKVLI